MPKQVFPLDSDKSFKDQEIIGHNRWHPDIPAAIHVKPDESFRLDCREWFDGAIKMMIRHKIFAMHPYQKCMHYQAP